jgi:hypothetical protein
MSTSPFVQNLRQSRKSPAVLKLRVLSVRSREKQRPIFIFEGIEDVGPYDTWIGRCDDSVVFEPLPANGKDQLLTFRNNVRPQETHLRSGIYFFIDRDFDDLKGFASGSDLFMTEMYSIENYLVSERVFKSVLLDELKCAGEQIDGALLLFRIVMDSFFEAIAPANRRIFYARHLAIKMKDSGIDDRVGKYIVAELEAVRVLATREDVKVLIPLEREPEAEEVRVADAEFNELSPPSRYRGKFILEFFLKWLNLLADERLAAKRAIFSSSIRTHFSAQQLSMRSLATRSDIPFGLSEFLANQRVRLTEPT